MAMVNAIIDELTREAETTKRVLERVPQDKLSWKPHPKAWSLGQLSLHIAQVPGAIAELITPPQQESPNFSQPEAKSMAEVFKAFDESVAKAKSKLAGWGDEGLMTEWKLTKGPKT